MLLPVTGPNANQAGRQIRILLGRSYLREYRLEAALEIFRSLLDDDPEDVDILLILADLYRASGSESTARRLYTRARELNPTNLLAQMKLQAADGTGNDEEEEPAPLAPEAIARLIERLRQRAHNKKAEVSVAADSLANYISAKQIGEQSRPVDEDIQQLLPALIELSVRDARAAGQVELAETLQSLHNQLTHHPNASLRCSGK